MKEVLNDIMKPPPEEDQAICGPPEAQNTVNKKPPLICGSFARDP